MSQPFRPRRDRTVSKWHLPSLAIANILPLVVIGHEVRATEGRRLLLEVMASRELSQADLQRELHVDASTTSKWLSSDRLPHWKLRMRMAELYAIPPESWDVPCANDGSATPPTGTEG